MTSTTTKQREKLSQIPDGAEELFSRETIIEPAEIGRLTWWFLQVFPTNESGLWLDALVNRNASTPVHLSVWGVRIVKNMLHGRIHYGSADGTPWCMTTNPIYDIEIGAINGLSSKSVSSLEDIRRTKLPAHRQTRYDLPPAKVYAKHREIVAKTVQHARDAVEEMLLHAYADAQPEHVQELDAYLSVAYAHVQSIRAVIAADTTPAPTHLQEVFLRITEPLVAGDGEDSGYKDESGTDSFATALPDYLAELPLFAAAT